MTSAVQKCRVLAAVLFIALFLNDVTCLPLNSRNQSLHVRNTMSNNDDTPLLETKPEALLRRLLPIMPWEWKQQANRVNGRRNKVPCVPTLPGDWTCKL